MISTLLTILYPIEVGTEFSASTDMVKIHARVLHCCWSGVLDSSGCASALNPHACTTLLLVPVPVRDARVLWTQPPTMNSHLSVVLESSSLNGDGEAKTSS